jgi:hypothetical protein
MLPSLAIIIQMGHDVHASVEDCGSVTEQFLTPFHSTVVRCDWFLHIPQFPQFADNGTAIDKMTQIVTDYGRNNMFLSC